MNAKKFLESKQSAKNVLNLKEKKEGFHYKAEIGVDVYEDDYNEGEGDFVRSYILTTLTSTDFRQLIRDLESYIGNKKGWNCENLNSYDFASEIWSSQLQDSDGNEASKYDMDMWKDGNKQLYSANYHVLVSRVGESPATVVDFLSAGLTLIN